MNALLAAVSLLTMLSAPKTVDVRVNAKDGEVIAGERTFRVTVQAEDPVTQVEFYVGDDLRDTDTSTPYEFKMDSLNESDGNLTLRFKAYTTENDSGTRTVRLRIDNGLSKGAAFHTEAAEKALQDNQVDAALLSGRIALKADPEYNPARLVMARANLRKGVLDTAQKYAEDAVAADPKSTAGLDLLATIQVRRAFVTYGREGSNWRDNMAVITEALKSGAKARRQSLDLRLDSLGPVTPQNAIQVADAAIAARRYSAAIAALRTLPNFTSDAPIANRIAYCQLREGDFRTAFTTTDQILRNGKPDSTTQAIRALAASEARDIVRMDEALKASLLDDPNNPVAKLAQAHIGLKFMRVTGPSGAASLQLFDRRSASARAASNNASELLRSLIAEPAQRAEVCVLLSALYSRQQDYGNGRLWFERSVTQEPLQQEAYLEMANRSIEQGLRSGVAQDWKDQAFAAAQSLFEVALTVKENSGQALTGLAIVSLFQNKAADALRFAESASRATPDFAAGHVTLAFALQTASGIAQREATRFRSAGEIDKARTAEAQAARYNDRARAATQAATAADRSVGDRTFGNVQQIWEFFDSASRLPLTVAPR